MNPADTPIKKAYGVYYTPGYVVDYIVDATLGRILQYADLADVERLRILDPACGRGAFLLGAYRKLLDWYLRHYLDQFSRVDRTRLIKTGPTDWRLTTRERLRILARSIFGVDRDRQAVRRARLALWLTALDAESAAWPCFEQFGDLDLFQNLQSGDALLGYGFDRSQPSARPPVPTKRSLLPSTDGVSQTCDGQLGHGFGQPSSSDAGAGLNWGQAYPQIQREGGFDLVIGNPPYHRERDHKQQMQRIRHAPLGRKYHVARMDLWYYFVHRGLDLLKPDGRLSFITSAYWMSAAAAEKLIATFRDQVHVDELFVLGNLKIFKNVSGQHTILTISNRPSSDPTTIKIPDAVSAATAADVLGGKTLSIEYRKRARQLFRAGGVDPFPIPDGLLAKIERAIPLGKLGTVRQGIAENPASINRRTNLRYGQQWRIGHGVFVLDRVEVDQLELSEKERRLLRPYHKLADLGRYFINPDPSSRLIYSTKQTCPNIDEYPAIREHLARFRVIMEQRRETRTGSNRWWHLHWPRDEAIWRAAKLVSLQMGPRPAFVPAFDPCYVSFSTNVFQPFELSHDRLYFLAGVLNSRLIWKWLQHHAKARGVGLEINCRILSEIPVPDLDSQSTQQRRRAAQIAKLARQMLSAQVLSASRPPAKAGAGALPENHGRLPRTSKTSTSSMGQLRPVKHGGSRTNRLWRLDSRIDHLVYELYGLNAQEIQSIACDHRMH